MEHLTEKEIDRIIEMAWEYRAPFEAIHFQFDIKERDVVKLMRRHCKKTSFRLWRKRMKNRNTKHTTLRATYINRFKCNRQRTISLNKISKR